jgi:hypothetical protein
MICARSGLQTLMVLGKEIRFEESGGEVATRPADMLCALLIAMLRLLQPCFEQVIMHEAAWESHNPALRTESCCHQYEIPQRRPVRGYRRNNDDPHLSHRSRNPSASSGTLSPPQLRPDCHFISLPIRYYKSSRFPGSHVFHRASLPFCRHLANPSKAY